MASRGVNKVILVGNLGADPESKVMTNGKTVTNFSIATSEHWNDQNGVAQSRTEWHRITLYQGLAEVAANYLKKGSQVYIEGKIETRKWQDQSGQDKYTTGIVGNIMQMLGGNPQGQQQGAQGGYQAPAPQPMNNNQPQYPNQGGQSPQQMGGQPQGGKAPQPMQEPDFDFDDDIPF